MRLRWKRNIFVDILSRIAQLRIQWFGRSISMNSLIRKSMFLDSDSMRISRLSIKEFHIMNIFTWKALISALHIKRANTWKHIKSHLNLLNSLESRLLAIFVVINYLGDRWGHFPWEVPLWNLTYFHQSRLDRLTNGWKWSIG